MTERDIDAALVEIVTTLLGRAAKWTARIVVLILLVALVSLALRSVGVHAV